MIRIQIKQNSHAKKKKTDLKQTKMNPKNRQREKAKPRRELYYLPVGAELIHHTMIGNRIWKPGGEIEMKIEEETGEVDSHYDTIRRRAGDQPDRRLT